MSLSASHVYLYVTFYRIPPILYHKKIILQGEMEQYSNIRLPLLIVMSFFLHLLLSVTFILPDYEKLFSFEQTLRKKITGSRDIIVNINEDNRKIVDRRTLLSDKDSAAKGFITREKGDRWLNNSRDFRLRHGDGKSSRRGRKVSVEKSRENFILNDNSEVVAILQKEAAGSSRAGQQGLLEEVAIPDKNDVTRNNAIYYSNSGLFSYNTVKFRHFEYFKKMKDKIAANWFPPIMANIAIGGYAPGRTRIMAIPNQEVRLYFILDRGGEVKEVKILDSLGNASLDTSCLESIRLSKNFGPVPKDMLKGNYFVVPFIFGFYSH